MQQSFGEFLKQKRQDKNLTQKELSKLLLVSESAVSKWEKDVAYPDITLLPKLSEILEVSEHELITSSVDKKAQEEKIQAKRWRTLTFSWNLFFYISYSITLLTCFVCNLAVNKTLSWFWIVACALLLSFCFTNLPSIIKKHKLILIPLSMFLSLSLLLGVCCLYTNGNWFWVAVLSVLLGLTINFAPIYISKYKIFAKFKSFNDFISVGLCFILLNILLIAINSYTLTNNTVNNGWYLTIALPIVTTVYLVLNMFLCIRFLKLNRILKTSIILFLINIFYIIPSFLKIKNINIQKELNSLNIFNANFSIWNIEATLANNVHCIIFLTILVLAIIFLVSGLLLHLKIKNKD